MRAWVEGVLVDSHDDSPLDRSDRLAPSISSLSELSHKEPSSCRVRQLVARVVRGPLSSSSSSPNDSLNISPKVVVFLTAAVDGSCYRASNRDYGSGPGSGRTFDDSAQTQTCGGLRRGW